MKGLFVALTALFLALPAVAAGPRWPSCAPILAFSADDIGVASFELEASTKNAGSWMCLVVNRASQKVRPVTREAFDGEFPGAIAAGNRQPGDCSEMLAPSAPGANVERDGQPTCVTTKVYCQGTEISVRVSSTVARLPCPSRLFSDATLIDDRLWVGISPLDPYRREYPGAGLLVQVLDGTVSSRLTPHDLGGRQICAIRKDAYSSSVWATTENGLVELTGSGKVKRVLQIRSPQPPAAPKKTR